MLKARGRFGYLKRKWKAKGVFLEIYKISKGKMERKGDFSDIEKKNGRQRGSFQI